jgi:hypothetical protein
MPRKVCVYDPFNRVKFWPKNRTFELMRRLHKVEKSPSGEWYLCSQAPLLIEVLGERGVIFKVTSKQLEKMRALEQVEPTGSGEWRLSKQGTRHDSTTRISSGNKITDAMGLSQDYTERDSKGRVWRFKDIDLIDRPAFEVYALFHDDPWQNEKDEKKEAEERAEREAEAAKVRRRNERIARAIANLRQRQPPDAAWVNPDSSVTVVWFKCDSAVSVGFT